ncbi:MAG TPA: SDR family NAD(P)-dependent oxidoreductase [Kofleriaceae bacterium]|nr:SDR family NAD(P)-dependent oxidoreductase [Kofleriaceae bacterium]
MILQGRTALVTGGGRGIGEAIARRLAAMGARVGVTGRTRGEIDAVAAALGGVALRADFADRESVDAMLRELPTALGPIDILVNNAGIAESAPLRRASDEMWDRTLEINVTAAFRITRALVPAMIEAGWGRVVNLASNAGVSGYRYSTAYCASKHALVGLTRALAVDLAPTGVTINAVCPGWVDTQMLAEAVDRIARKTGRSEDQARASLAEMSPQGRVVSPDEVAHLVASLCAEEARSIHGQALVIDGGAILK